MESNRWSQIQSINGLIWQIIRRLIHKNREDCYQHVVLALHAKMDNYDPAKGALTTWASYVVVNIVYEYMSQQTVIHIPRHRYRGGLSAELAKLVEPCELMDVCQPAVVASMEVEALMILIDRLSLNERTKDILRMRLSGMTMSAIALHYGVSKQMVNLVLQNVYKKLRLRRMEFEHIVDLLEEGL